MYIHLGTDITVLKKSITAVINLEEVPPSDRKVVSFINSEDERGRLQYASEEVPKTVVITDEGTYMSSLSSNVLQKRLLNDDYL